MVKLFIADYFDNIVDFEVESVYLKKFQVQVDFGSKSLRNNLIISSGLETDVSFKWLNSQIRFANECNFRKISINAWRDEEEPSYKGYYIWARYGFEMSDPDDVYRFMLKVRQFDPGNKFQITSLHMLQSIPEGHKFWKDNGFPWKGEFDLNPESQNMIIFNRVREEMSKKPY